jgi:hypothetical protein
VSPENTIQYSRLDAVAGRRAVLGDTWFAELAEGTEKNYEAPDRFPDIGLGIPRASPVPASRFPVVWSVQ